ncbi:MAG: hypothetical protein ACETWT_08530 [Thermodesulfobacteriota bacterium]
MRGDNDEAWNFGDMGNQYVAHTIAEILLLGSLLMLSEGKTAIGGF